MLFISTVSLLQGWSPSTAPHEGEADLKGWWVILKVDDHREEKRGDKVGQGDNDWREVLVDEVHHEVLLQEKKKTNQLQLFDAPWWQDNNYKTVNVGLATFILLSCACWEVMVAT